MSWNAVHCTQIHANDTRVQCTVPSPTLLNIMQVCVLGSTANIRTSLFIEGVVVLLLIIRAIEHSKPELYVPVVHTVEVEGAALSQEPGKYNNVIFGFGSHWM